MNKKAEAIYEFNQAALNTPTIDEQFIIFRYKKMFEDIDESMGDGNNKNSDEKNLNVIDKFAYESSVRQWHIEIETTATLHVQFWNYLRDDRPDISKLNECGSKINHHIIQVESFWKRIAKFNQNGIKDMKLYSKFRLQILNDKEGSESLLQKVKEVSNANDKFYENKEMINDPHISNTLSNCPVPCIVVSGDESKIGIINQCNASASRLFGFLTQQMKGHNVEILMPELYAKKHSQILIETIEKSGDQIPTKERMVFARHTSGYIFPVWIQLKVVSNTIDGVQFVALFKVDKKMINANIGYILINKERMIQGVSSSCLNLLELDTHCVKKLTMGGIKIIKIIQDLFKKDTYEQKNGDILEWNQEIIDKWKYLHLQSMSKSPKRSNSFKKQSEMLYFYGKLTSIEMGSFGKIGWYLRLDTINERPVIEKLSKAMAMKLNKKGVVPGKKFQDYVKQPLFQFRYNGPKGIFVREINETGEDNAAKDPKFIKEQYQQLIIKKLQKKSTYELIKYGTGDQLHMDKTFSKIESDVQPLLKIEEEMSEQKDANVSGDIKNASVKSNENSANQTKQNNSLELLKSKRRYWAKNITTYRLVNGKFEVQDHEKELQLQRKVELEKKREKEREEEAKDLDEQTKNQLKSKKGLQIAVNKQQTPQAIKNVQRVMNVIVLVILALCITEFVLVNNQIQEIFDNFGLVWQSYGRISEVQRVSYDIRTLILINEGKQKVYKNYTTWGQNFTDFLKNDMNDALSTLYSLQSKISMSQVSMSKEQEKLVHENNVKLYFRYTDDNYPKIIKFTLNEAVLQMSSSIFLAVHMDISQFTSQQNDLYFIIYNSYNDFLIALRQSAKYYGQQLLDTAVYQEFLMYVLFFVSIALLVLAFFVMIPVIRHVKMSKLHVLLLFMQIPNDYVHELAEKCENFVANIGEEEAEEIASEDDEELQKDEASHKSKSNQKDVKIKASRKQPRNMKSSNNRTFFQFGFAALLVIGYFNFIFFISSHFMDELKNSSMDMNLLAQSESYYVFAQNVQKEMIYNPDMPVLNEKSFEVARDTIKQLFQTNKRILEDMFDNRNIINSDYRHMYLSVFNSDLCVSSHLKIDLIPFNCTQFLNSVATHGLRSILPRYFETLKETLKSYVLYQNSGKNVTDLFNTNSFLELYIMESRFINDSIEILIKSLIEAITKDFQTIIDTRMSTFIFFVIAIIFAFVLIWLPFVNNLNKEIWRTKNMLTLIPIEVIMKIPKIQHFLKNQNFFTTVKAD